MHKIVPIPALSDNYIWCIIHTNTQQCAIVDPGEAQPVIDFLDQNDLKLSSILVTHHHWDHTNGINELQDIYDIQSIYGSIQSSIKSINIPVQEGDSIVIETLKLKLNVMEIPGHTLDHIAFYNDEVLFCGDTLFSAGCGRVFEGTPEQMLTSLKKLRSLPDDTLLYCGHEYTQANLAFAKLVEPNNSAIEEHTNKVTQLINNNHPSLPNSMGIEKQINPFLRCHLTEVQTSAEQHSRKALSNECDVFATVRSWKDNWS